MGLLSKHKVHNQEGADPDENQTTIRMHWQNRGLGRVALDNSDIGLAQQALLESKTENHGWHRYIGKL